MTHSVLRAHCRLRLDDFVLDISLDADRELVVLFGPSGAGKSLTLKTLAGLKSPEEGEIILGERTLYNKQQNINLKPQERSVGYVPQSYALLPHRTIRENIRYGLSNVPREEAEARTEELLDQMSLASVASKRPAEVSGGQEQRTALARALARQPELLLMDEPFGALEETLRRRLSRELQQLQEVIQIPILLVTHSLREAYNLAESIVVIDDGSMIQQGQPQDVFNKPANSQVAALLGMTNLLSVKVVTTVDNQAICSWQGTLLRAHSAVPAFVGQQRILGIRPENIHLARSDRALQGANENHLTGTILQCDPDGYEAMLTVQIWDSDTGETAETLTVRIWMRDLLHLPLGPGARVNLSFDPADAWLLAE